MCANAIVRAVEKKWLLFLISLLSFVSTIYLLADSGHIIFYEFCTKAGNIFPGIIACMNTVLGFAGFILNIFLFFAIYYDTDARRGHMFVLFYVIDEFCICVMSGLLSILSVIGLFQNVESVILSLPVFAPICLVSAISLIFFIPYHRKLKLFQDIYRLRNSPVPVVNQAPLESRVESTCPQSCCNPVVISVPPSIYDFGAPPQYEKVFGVN
ncbi:hypothetical protein L596_029512 [Steinernema carpocapsae]|uniref:Uncharacterized protein n=1 Tax=Steinernema carpocapsae TaxID=34508 RepID=A0A4V5ZXJ5_STECR|nr:hypothetical protein L596_029498 [Steinernema carpocapsae]TKR59905.1 hypothetical protein L596_029512 [Steinernema carpocapsae]